MGIKFKKSQKQKKIFILGSTGFAGFAVTRKLIEMGFQNIYCLYRNENKKTRMFQGLNTSAITFLQGHKFPITILAPSFIWGPGDQIYVPTFVERLKKKQLLYIGKEVEMDFIHVNDMVDGILRCFFNRKAYNQDFIFNGPKPFSFHKYIKKIAEYTGFPQPPFSVPVPVMLVIGFMMEVTARFVNLFSPHFRPLITRFQVYLFSKPVNVKYEKAKKELGFDPKIDFSQGIEELREYVRECSLPGINPH